MKLKDKKLENSLDNKIIKMSNILARRTPKSKINREPFTLAEQQLFYMSLTKANEISDKGIIKLKKTEVFE